MSNKFTEGAASILAHLHPASEWTEHAEHTEHFKPSCPTCSAENDDISTNDLPTHHAEFTCKCLKCGYEWMPNSDE